MRKPSLSKIRATAGRAGADARWGTDGPRATACLRAYPADAAEIRRRASAAGRLPADEIDALLRPLDVRHPITTQDLGLRDLPADASLREILSFMRDGDDPPYRTDLLADRIEAILAGEI